MFYKNELAFLCDVFKRSHINAVCIEESAFYNKLTDNQSSEPLFEKALIKRSLPLLRPQTIYRLTDTFERSYRILILPHTEKLTILYIGPFLSVPISAKQLWEICEKNEISPQKQRHLFEYYQTLPVLPSNDHLFIMLHSFCEKIWQTPSFAVKDITSPKIIPDFFSQGKDTNIRVSEDTLVNMKAMERRYAFENDLIRAVTLGQLHKEAQICSAFSAKFFEKRSSDPLRNAKNYGIIMNTLLRKAAEAGGVHPIYIDRTSSEFAIKIENMSSLAENTALMREIFCTYCHLVRKHSVKKYPSVVQKIIMLINTNLSADLSPNILAKKLEISLGYLSSVFKKEIGKTISEYIRERRMELAAYLLNTTELQIQTVALHCGIMDVQYFSKIFKKLMGKTPSEYRNEFKREKHKTLKTKGENIDEI